ncbi:ubiquitin-conjugating enzyme/RWD-like protein [Coprinopsis sp. MPI-PUGE-AT-0042]|nr:ubiquitin-conjugating enzyme/RWD-like protein [Coprinopsis sp. MPI-PUGE-AT-0042]
MLDVTGIIAGPEETPYAGGYFKVRFVFTEEFPAAPPKCWFSTKLFHPNVGPAGEICVNTLKKDWKSTYGIQHILVTVKCLLIYPTLSQRWTRKQERCLWRTTRAIVREQSSLLASMPHHVPSQSSSRHPQPQSQNQPAKPSTADAVTNLPAPTTSKTASASSTSCINTYIFTATYVTQAGSPGPQQSLGLKSAPSVEKALKQERHPSRHP